MNNINAKNSVFLATTALSDFWITDGRILFLGEWCLRYDKKHEWEALSYEMMAYPWDNRENLSLAIVYCESIYEKILSVLSASMNRIHGMTYSPKYWRIVLGPWLLRYIHSMYDKYICLTEAFKRYPALTTITLSRESYITPTDFFDFYCRYTEDPYNLQLYSQILEEMRLVFPSKARRSHIENKLLGPSRKLRMFVKNIFGQLSILVSPRRRILLFDTHLRQSDIWKLCLVTRFKTWPISYDGKFNTGVEGLKVRKNLRRKLDIGLGDSEKDEFHDILLRTIPVNLPISYLEGYHIIRKYNRYLQRKDPEGVMSSFGWTSNERFKSLVAELSEKGGTLLGLQHGGATGVNRYSPGETHVIKVSDAYYTWGWQDKNSPKIVPLSDPRINDLVNQKKTRYHTKVVYPALFAGTVFPRYLQTFRFCPTGSQVKRYFDWQVRFFCALPDSIRRKFIVRLGIRANGLWQKKRLSDNYPELIFDHGIVPFEKQIEKSGLVVIDNWQTTFLETVAMDRPTVLFYDKHVWDIVKEAQDCAMALHDTGILHFEPEYAARHVLNVLDDPETWWHSSRVRNARKKYLSYITTAGGDWEKTWQRELKSRCPK